MTDSTDNARPLGPWQAWPGSRADLPPSDADVLAHPKVRALVEAVKAMEVADERFEGEIPVRLITEVYQARAALAALEAANV